MEYTALTTLLQKKKSLLCVGLDTDPQKIPSVLRNHPDPIFEFNKQIIDATYPYAVAYKPNMAFYEAMGAKGWESLARTMEYMPKDVFRIADAKRGDIGNTAAHYARAFFEYFNFDAITLSPYMGYDSLAPFLEYPNKWVIVLARTSNASSHNFQNLLAADGRPIYLHVVEQCMQWASHRQLMFVAGATQTEALGQIRSQAPDYFLLVPGIGSQGGDLEQVIQNGRNQQGGMLINASRSILYASPHSNFAEAAARQAAALQQQMQQLLAW